MLLVAGEACSLVGKNFFRIESFSPVLPHRVKSRTLKWDGIFHILLEEIRLQLSAGPV